MTMTRIHRRAGVAGRVADGGPGAGGHRGSVTADRRCGRCGTRVEVDVDPAERIRMILVGPTCPQCEAGRRRPERTAPDGSTADATLPCGAEVVKMWWGAGEELLPELEVRTVVGSEAVANVWPSSAVPHVGRPDLRDVDEGLRVSIATVLAGTLGADVTDHMMIAWRPQYCRMLVAQAGVLRGAATLTNGQQGLRILLRLVGAPAPVAAITVEAFGRMCATPRYLSLTYAAYTMETIGAALCLCTGQVDDCPAIDALASLWPESAGAVQLWRAVQIGVGSALTQRPPMPPFAEVMASHLEGADGPSVPGDEDVGSPGPMPPDPPNHPGVSDRPGLEGLRTLLPPGPPAGPLVFGRPA
jgi:hypothetical protein